MFTHFVVTTIGRYMHLMLAQKTSGTYATAAESVRINGKPMKANKIYLGRVVDLKKGVFENKLISRERTKNVNEIYKLFGNNPPAFLKNAIRD